MAKMNKEKKINNLLEDTINTMSNLYANELNKQIFSSLPMFVKPVKYYTVPRIVIRIPYLKFDTEYDSEWGEGRKGLFLEWKEIHIGSKREENLNYKEEMKKWKGQPKTIKLNRYSQFK